ncbi:MAG TPA: hypothetical protein VNQ34_05880 [Xanthobacteraceae bacterium]|nr:hypothetical protein [Xanthobacteraceae bacterium]
MAKALENIPEFLQHGDEDLIELGRKFADALERQVQYKNDHTDDGPWSVACNDAFDCCDAAIKLRATTPLGVRIKAWLALYQCKVLCEITPAGEVDSKLVCSLLLDLVPAAQQGVPGENRKQKRIWDKFKAAA